jgi:hypothetical protein
MTKILLVEKRYDENKNSPLVTANWIEVPDGEEELFLAEQLAVVNEKLLPEKQNVKFIETENKNIVILKIEDELVTQQEALAQKRLILILNLFSFGIVIVAATLVFAGLSYYGVWK